MPFNLSNEHEQGSHWVLALMQHTAATAPTQSDPDSHGCIKVTLFDSMKPKSTARLPDYIRR
jgi:hypothetical protein